MISPPQRTRVPPVPPCEAWAGVSGVYSPLSGWGTVAQAPRASAAAAASRGFHSRSDGEVMRKPVVLSMVIVSMVGGRSGRPGMSFDRATRPKIPHRTTKCTYGGGIGGDLRIAQVHP